MLDILNKWPTNLFKQSLLEKYNHDSREMVSTVKESTDYLLLQSENHIWWNLFQHFSVYGCLIKSCPMKPNSIIRQ